MIGLAASIGFVLLGLSLLVLRPDLLWTDPMLGVGVVFFMACAIILACGSLDRIILGKQKEVEPLSKRERAVLEEQARITCQCQ